MRYTQNRQEATAITNTVFLKVMTQTDRYEQTGAVGGWICKIALYTSIDFVRQRAVHQKHYILDTIPESPVRNDAIDRLSEEALLQLIQELPFLSRTVFCLFVIEGFSHEEIGKQLNIPTGTSKWHLSTARSILKSKLQTAENQQTSTSPKTNHPTANTPALQLAI
jgi:RNA polymerase sigma-70 factor (ECF subfamily)